MISCERFELTYPDNRCVNDDGSLFYQSLRFLQRSKTDLRRKLFSYFRVIQYCISLCCQLLFKQARSHMCWEISEKYLLHVGTENTMVMAKAAGISTFAVTLQKMSTVPTFRPRLLPRRCLTGVRLGRTLCARYLLGKLLNRGHVTTRLLLNCLLRRLFASAQKTLCVIHLGYTLSIQSALFLLIQKLT